MDGRADDDDENNTANGAVSQTQADGEGATGQTESVGEDKVKDTDKEKDRDHTSADEMGEEACSRRELLSQENLQVIHYIPAPSQHRGACSSAARKAHRTNNLIRSRAAYSKRLLADALTYKSKVSDLETIVRCGGDINGPVKRGLRPLHYAVHVGYLEGIRFLLRKGADVDVADNIGYRPVHLCARKGEAEKNYNITREFRKKRKLKLTRDFRLKKLGERVITFGNADALQILIDNGACVDFFVNSVDISDASKNLGYLTIEPLNMALENDHEEVARLLLSNGARPDHRYFLGYEINLVPLEHLECLKLLLEYGADPNVFSRCGLSPLMKASKQHNIRAARILLDGSADINLQPPGSFEQKTAIHYAIESGSNGITNMFLRRGAVVGRPPGYRYSALHTAVVCDRPEFCKLLLRWDASVDELTDEGSTPLQLACALPSLAGRLEIVQILLLHGANVNVNSSFVSFSSPYLSPLTEYMRCAADSVDYNIVYQLVSFGAKVSFKAASTSSRTRDPHGILHCVQYLKDKPEILRLLINVSRSFDLVSIEAYTGLSQEQKQILLSVASSPRDLKSCVRFSLRDYWGKDLDSQVARFPLPDMVKNFLLCKY